MSKSEKSRIKLHLIWQWHGCELPDRRWMQWMLMVFYLILMIWQWLMNPLDCNYFPEGRKNGKLQKVIQFLKRSSTMVYTHISQYLMSQQVRYHALLGEIFQDLTQVTGVSIAWPCWHYSGHGEMGLDLKLEGESWRMLSTVINSHRGSKA